jgi:type II secretory pathway component GspD/PulD (secretin)
MQLNKIATGKRGMAATAVLAAIALAFAILALRAGAQTKPEDTQPGDARPAAQRAPETVQTIFLTNASEQNDLYDIQNDLRNALPGVNIFVDQAQDAITVRGTSDNLETAQKIVADLDRPRKVYRLTYTITDLDGGKRVGSQKLILLVVSGERTTFKQGSRVPIVTGTTEGQPRGTQVQYQDVGLSIEARVNGSPSALDLHTKIEQSSLAEEKPIAPAQDPVVRQTALDESSVLSQGKSLVLGSLDLPGTTRSQEIEVVAELVR